MLQNVLWRVLRHGHHAPAAPMLTAICNDPYSFHIESSCYRSSTNRCANERGTHVRPPLLIPAWANGKDSPAPLWSEGSAGIWDCSRTSAAAELIADLQKISSS